jgi:BirA family transcriptional regulator, biotin operon repressor / biotin---[acetyl-CoA-carboxylase] ligase
MPETRFTDVRRFATLDSTNRYLLDEARAGAPEGVVAVADHQTAGRGRLGRTWEAPAGANLLVSVLLRPDLRPEQRHLAATAVALAAVDAIAVSGAQPRAVGRPGAAGGGHRGGSAVGIKWPNDLVAPDGRKLAGVLAEADLASVTPGSAPPVVVGIGINVNWPATDADLPPELRGVACSLRELAGGEVDREALLVSLLEALVLRVTALATPAGRIRLADDLRAGCTTLGTTVRVDLADGSFVGTATSVTDDGHLEVDVDGTPRTVVAGDVVHVRPGD